VMVRDCYTKQDQDAFLKVLTEVDAASQGLFNKTFQSLTAEERLQVVNQLDKEAKAYQQDKEAEAPNHYFHLFKQLTLLGFFSSELGATKALRYVQIPGRYDGDIPYQKGDKAWA
jgi:hypothetical protein